MLTTPVHIETVPRSVMFAAECAHEPRRRHMGLNVIADVLARAAGFAAKAAQVEAVGGLAQQVVDAGFQLGDVSVIRGHAIHTHSYTMDAHE